MADHDRVDGVVCGELRVADAVLQVAATGVGLGAEDMAARMQCLQPFEGRLQPVRQRVTGGVHAREQGVPAARRHLSGVKHRAHRGCQVVAVVGVPAIADVLALRRLLAHLGDHRITGHGREETVDVDAAEALSKGEICSGVSSWSRKKITACSPKAWRLSANTGSGSGVARSMPPISAPSGVASGSTRMWW